MLSLLQLGQYRVQYACGAHIRHVGGDAAGWLRVMRADFVLAAGSLAIGCAIPSTGARQRVKALHSALAAHRHRTKQAVPNIAVSVRHLDAVCSGDTPTLHEFGSRPCDLAQLAALDLGACFVHHLQTNLHSCRHLWLRQTVQNHKPAATTLGQYQVFDQALLHAVPCHTTMQHWCVAAGRGTT